jgi:hypothetical protein
MRTALLAFIAALAVVAATKYEIRVAAPRASGVRNRVLDNQVVYVGGAPVVQSEVDNYYSPKPCVVKPETLFPKPTQSLNE